MAELNGSRDIITSSSEWIVSKHGKGVAIMVGLRRRAQQLQASMGSAGHTHILYLIYVINDVRTSSLDGTSELTRSLSITRYCFVHRVLQRTRFEIWLCTNFPLSSDVRERRPKQRMSVLRRDEQPLV